MVRNGKKVGEWCKPKKRARIYARDNLRCIYCNSDSLLSLDHVRPRELGGGNESSNLVTACVTCNCAKKEKTLSAFLSWLEQKGLDAKVINKRIRNAKRRVLPSLTEEQIQDVLRLGRSPSENVLETENIESDEVQTARFDSELSGVAITAATREGN